MTPRYCYYHNPSLFPSNSIPSPTTSTLKPLSVQSIHSNSSTHQKKSTPLGRWCRPSSSPASASSCSSSSLCGDKSIRFRSHPIKSARCMCVCVCVKCKGNSDSIPFDSIRFDQRGVCSNVCPSRKQGQDSTHERRHETYDGSNWCAWPPLPPLPRRPVRASKRLWIRHSSMSCLCVLCDQGRPAGRSISRLKACTVQSGILYAYVRLPPRPSSAPAACTRPQTTAAVAFAAAAAAAADGADRRPLALALLLLLPPLPRRLAMCRGGGGRRPHGAAGDGRGRRRSCWPQQHAGPLCARVAWISSGNRPVWWLVGRSEGLSSLVGGVLNLHKRAAAITLGAAAAPCSWRARARAAASVGGLARPPISKPTPAAR